MDAPAMIAALWLLAGFIGGMAHFVLLRHNATLYAAGGLTRAIAVQMLRMMVLTALLVFAAWHGALPLLFVAIGIVIARPLALHMTAGTP